MNSSQTYSKLPIAARASSALLGSAIVAGLGSGVLIDAFLSLVMHRSPVAIWQFVASTIIGPVAFTSPSHAILGFAVHFATSLVWAVIYLYVFGALGQLKNWIVGGIVWGVVVDAAMNLLLAVKIGAPFVPAFAQGLLPHIVFYALPIAWYIARKVPKTA